MKFRNLIFVLAIAFSAIFLSMIGTSYAWFLATGGTTIEVTTGNIDTGVVVVFEQSQYINVNTGVPINESDVDTLAKSSNFTLKPDVTLLSEADVAINLGITDLSVADELRISDFKYKLTCNDGTNDMVIGSGDGTKITDAVISSEYLELGTITTDDGSLDINKTYNCALKIWLQETGADQNALMNKKLSGLIRVNTLFKMKEE